MALHYEHREAKLGDIDGMGYVFRVNSVFGDRYKGVFIASDNGADVDLGGIADTDEVTFSGTVYRKTRSGTVSAQKSVVTVEITDVDTVALGERAIFEVTETE